MIELQPTEFSRAVPLLQGIRQEVVPYAVCEGNNVGRVFVDAKEKPHTALVWTTVGYYFLAGKVPEGLDSLRHLLCEELIPASLALGETGFVLMDSGNGWKEVLPALLPQRKIIEIYRRPHRFEPQSFLSQADWRARIPAGFRLQRLDAALAERAGLAPTWASSQKFVENGLGFALLAGDEMACVCSSVFAGNGRLEIDLHTVEAYRRRGFAVITASAFIESCLEKNFLPNWECWWENEPSCRLAQHLGFSALPDYPVNFWEEKTP